jgi:hypothetical protein
VSDSNSVIRRLSVQDPDRLLKLIRELERRAEEDRAAIRAFKKQHDDFPPESCEEGKPCQCYICHEHALTIARAERREGDG